jgi:hypothetical protein
MMKEGWLCGLRAVKLTTNSDISQVKIHGSDFSSSQLSETINTKERNDLIVKMWKKVPYNLSEWVIISLY